MEGLCAANPGSLALSEGLEAIMTACGWVEEARYCLKNPLEVVSEDFSDIEDLTCTLVPEEPETAVLTPSENCGTLKSYQKGCRCSECKAANTEYYRAYRARKCSC